MNDTTSTNGHRSNGAGQHRADRPAWTQRAHKLDMPNVDTWYKPEQGALDGVLLWHGDQEDTRNGGGTYHVFVIREDKTELHIAVRERAALRGLRAAKLGARVFIEPRGRKDLGDGRSMWEFDVMAEQLADAKPAGGGEPRDGDDAIPF